MSLRIKKQVYGNLTFASESFKHGACRQADVFEMLRRFFNDVGRDSFLFGRMGNRLVGLYTVHFILSIHMIPRNFYIFFSFFTVFDFFIDLECHTIVAGVFHGPPI